MILGPPSGWVGVLGPLSSGAIVTSFPGRCIVTWELDWINNGVVAQCYDITGAALWGPNPVTASTFAAYLAFSERSLVAEPDFKDGAILSWITPVGGRYPV